MTRRSRRRICEYAGCAESFAVGHLAPRGYNGRYCAEHRERACCPCGHPEWMHTSDGCQGDRYSDGDRFECHCDEFGQPTRTPPDDWNPGDAEGCW